MIEPPANPILWLLHAKWHCADMPQRLLDETERPFIDQGIGSLSPPNLVEAWSYHAAVETLADCIHELLHEVPRRANR